MGPPGPVTGLPLPLPLQIYTVVTILYVERHIVFEDV
jgi:hypothetical protein